jgi:hypothetical protein
MRRPVLLGLAAAVFLAGVLAAVALASTGTATVCATSPVQTISANGVKVGTISPKVACITATYMIPTVTNTVTQTVTVTQPGTTTTPPPSGCFQSPGSCGYPDPAFHNVGVPQGTNLTPSGSITVTTPGAVIDGLDVSGGINVQANNVTIKNTRVNCTTCAPGDSAVLIGRGFSGLAIQNSEVSGGSIDDFGSGDSSTTTLDHVYVHDCGECVHYMNTITDSYIVSCYCVVAGAHYEPVFTDKDFMNVQHSVLLNPHIQTAALMAGKSSGPCSIHLSVTNSLLAGGGFVIYPCANTSSAGTSVVTFTGNRFARCTETPTTQNGANICTGFPFVDHGSDSFMAQNGTDGQGYFPSGGQFGFSAYIYCGQTTWTGNIWDDNGAAVSCDGT